MLPGRAFASPADFNAQFTDWLDRADSRVVRTLRVRRADLIDADRAAMLPLPAVPPDLGWHHRVRLGRDSYVRLDASDYSVSPAVIGQVVEVRADLDRVLARTDGHVVADHARVWARGITVTDPAHAEQPGSCGRSSASNSAGVLETGIRSTNRRVQPAQRVSTACRRRALTVLARSPAR